MKVNCILAFLFLSSASAVETNLRTTSKNENGTVNDVAKQSRGLQIDIDKRIFCNFIPEDKYLGPSTLIKVDNSQSSPAQGDVSIANSLMSTGGGTSPKSRLSAPSPL